MSVLTALRHVVAVLASWLTMTALGALGLKVGPDTLAQLTEAVTVLGMLVMLGLYALIEKYLKPLFRRMGEVDGAPAAPPKRL